MEISCSGSTVSPYLAIIFPENVCYGCCIFLNAQHGVKRCEPRHEISNNVVCATSKGSDQPAHTRSLIGAIASRLNIYMSVKLLTEHHLEFLSLKRGCTGSSESTLVKRHIVGNHMSRLL